MKGFFTYLLTVFGILLLCSSAVKAEQFSGPWSYELTSEGLVINGFAGTDPEVVIPDEIEGNKVSIIGKSAFRDNHTMRSLVIPEGVTGIRAEAFFGCTGLSLIEFNAKNCTAPEVWIYDGNKGCGVFSGAGSSSPTGLKVVFGEGVARIPDHLFDTASLNEYGKNGYPCASVTEVEISDGVKEIGVCAFRSCGLLEKVTFGAGLKLIEHSRIALISPTWFSRISSPPLEKEPSVGILLWKRLSLVMDWKVSASPLFPTVSHWRHWIWSAL